MVTGCGSTFTSALGFNGPRSDRAAPMTSQCTAQLLADLGVTRSLSRPHVGDDNHFSDSGGRR